jgi:hypothetical protein
MSRRIAAAAMSTIVGTMVLSCVALLPAGASTSSPTTATAVPSPAAGVPSTAPVPSTTTTTTTPSRAVPAVTPAAAPARAAAGPNVEFSFASASVAVGTSPMANVCWTSAPSGSVLQLAVVGKGHHLAVVFNVTLSSASNCMSATLRPATVGARNYVAKLFSGSAEIAESPRKLLFAYASVPGAKAFGSLGLSGAFSGCATYGTPLTVADDSNTYGSFCSFRNFSSGQKAAGTSSPYLNTCRALNLRVLADPSPLQTSPGSVTLTVKQTGVAAQTVQVTNGVVSSYRFPLNGSRLVLSVSSTSADSLYVLSVGTSMSCLSTTAH